ncbi:MAG: glycosyltransferase [Candidatus Binatia bacterium]
MSDKLKVIVLGMMGRCPFGGQTWLYLNWLRGLNRLGHEVWYVEDDTVWPYDPERNSVTDDCSYAVRHIADCMKRVGMADRWAFRPAYRARECYGISTSKLDELYRTCNILLNVVGATDLREEHLAVPLRVYVECDPVIAELKLANGDEHTAIALANHNVIVTYGENFGTPDCGVPLNGLRYGKIRQPLDLDLWPMVYDPESRFFTTIGNYRQAGNDVEYNGEVYRWSKHHEWEKFLELPRRTEQPFQLAMMPEDPVDRERLKAHGWQLVSPFRMSLDIFGAYPAYFHRSRAEFTVAKDMNVRLQSGWFSERDACYLACGKPVVAQDTGFGDVLPTGEGLFAFTTIAEAIAAIDEINGDYRRHCLGARAIAEEYFEASKIAARLLAHLGVD